MSFHDRGVMPAAGTTTDEFLLRPIRPEDAALDYEAVMETKEFLRIWEQSTWPEDDFTVEANREDMVKMADWHATGRSYGYTVMNLDETECFGCVYMSPPDVSWFADAEVTAVGDKDWTDVDAMLSFWVRASRLTDQIDRKLLDALRAWFTADWNLANPVFSTMNELQQQIDLLEAAGLHRAFEAKKPDQPGTYLLYS